MVQSFEHSGCGSSSIRRVQPSGCVPTDNLGIEASAPSHTGPLLAGAALRGKHIFVTGGTGFLGKVWLAYLLEHAPDIGSVTLLVRGRQGRDGTERVRAAFATSPVFRRLRARHGPGLAAFLQSTIRVLQGEVTRAGCGLRLDVQRALRAHIDLTVHFAGVTDFEADPLTALAVNIDGLRHLVDMLQGGAEASSEAEPPVSVQGGERANNLQGEGERWGATHSFRPPFGGKVGERVLDSLPNTRGHVTAAPPEQRHPPRVLFCSTAFVAGNQSGNIAETVTPGCSPNGILFDVDEEIEALSRLRNISDKGARVSAALERAAKLGWPNVYTFSKALAEHWLALHGGPYTTIVRPSIVESARAFPFPGWNEGINTSAPLVWLLSQPFRRFPTRSAHFFDVVPVDDVAKGLSLVCAALLSGRHRAVYHLASGDQNPLTFARAVDLTALGVRRRFGRAHATRLQRYVLQHLDAVPSRFVAPQSMLLDLMAGGLRQAKALLRQSDRMPDALLSRRKQWLAHLRAKEREVGRMQSLLRLYRPFIRENNYRYITRNIRELSRAMLPGERETWAFDLRSLDWYAYWLYAQIPGLERWSLPLMEGERVPLDVAADDLSAVDWDTWPAPFTRDRQANALPLTAAALPLAAEVGT